MPDALPSSPSLTVTDNTIYCHGLWQLHHLGDISQQPISLDLPQQSHIVLNGQHIRGLDTAGSWLLQEYIQYWQTQDKTIDFQHFKSKHLLLLKRIAAEKAKITQSPIEKAPSTTLLYGIGKETVSKLNEIRLFSNFLGEMVVTWGAILLHPKRIQWRSILSVIQSTGYNALPIIALLSFLIGIVLAYQMGLQLDNYGANIYVVDFTGIAILREFGPLVVAIIVAGRTGSAFTAQLGAMKVNEEIAALYTLGLSPQNRLILPKVIGLLVAVPLLTIWANIFGTLGAMTMAHHMLDIEAVDFIRRFELQISLKHYWVGMVKTPVFAAIIATVGCFQGLRVKNSAESIGTQTTKSVVQAIFLIIIASAAFSVYFSWRGI